MNRCKLKSLLQARFSVAIPNHSCNAESVLQFRITVATPISGFAVVFAVVSKDSWCVRYHNSAFAEVYEMGDVIWKVFDVDVTSCARCGERLWMGKMFGGECYVNQLRFIAHN